MLRLVLMALAMAANAPSAAASEPDVPVRQLYRAFTASEAPDVSPWFTPGYNALKAACATAQARIEARFGEGESFGACGEEASSLCECQDLDERLLDRTLVVSTRVVASGVAIAQARFRLFADDPGHTIHLRVVETAKGWLVDDVVDADRRSVDRAAYLKGINQMRRRLRQPPIPAPPLTVPRRAG